MSVEEHTTRFTSPLEVGEHVTGIATGKTDDGITYETRFAGIYEGVKPSEWDGEPIHLFRDGIIGETPQAVFGFPVAQDAPPDGFRRIKITGEWTDKVYPAIIREGAAGYVSAGPMPFVDLFTMQTIVADQEFETAQEAHNAGLLFLEMEAQFYGYDVIAYDPPVAPETYTYGDEGYPDDGSAWGLSNLLDDPAYAVAHPGDGWFDVGAFGWVWEELPA